eukprot:8817470-Pyramimonas_sp.AAC.1
MTGSAPGRLWLESFQATFRTSRARGVASPSSQRWQSHVSHASLRAPSPTSNYRRAGEPSGGGHDPPRASRIARNIFTETR